METKTADPFSKLALLCGILALPALATVLWARDWANMTVVGLALWAIAIVGLGTGIRAMRAGENRGVALFSAATCAALFVSLIWLTYLTYR